MRQRQQVKKCLPVILSVCLLTGLVIFRASAILAASAATTTLTNDDFLSVKNGVLVNKKGTAVTLRGVNLGGWLIQESWMCPVNGADRAWANLDSIQALQNRGFTQSQIQTLFTTYQDNWITTKDLDIIAATGCNVVRVPFWYRNFMSDASGTWIDSNFDSNPGFQKLDWIVTEAGNRGMYVILDMHGCPGGQSMDHCCGTLAKNELYTNETYKAAMQKLWVAIAARYKGNPAVAAYDIMNEPNNNSGYSGSNSYDPWSSSTWELTNAIYRRMVPAIRAVDPDHAITVEGIWRITNLPNPNTEGWTNMIYQVHLYDDTSGFTTLAASTASTCISYGTAGYVGEFSNMDGLSICNTNGLSWTTWTYKAGKSVGDWAWYQKNAEVADTTSDSYSEILRKWGSGIRTENGFSANSSIINKISAAAYIEDTSSYARYEAENGNVNYGSVVTGNSNFSGSSFVGNMNTQSVINSVLDISSNWSNIPYVKYTVNVDTAGTYNMKIGYATQTSTVYAYVRVNDDSFGNWKAVSMNTTSSWQSVGTVTVSISLKAGQNTIWVSGSTKGSSSDNWINYDYIQLPVESSGSPTPTPTVTPTLTPAATPTPTVTPTPTATPTPTPGANPSIGTGTTRIEAETAMINYGIVKTESAASFSGGGHVGNLNTQAVINSVSDISPDWSNIPYIKYTVDAQAAGTYTMKIGYATQTSTVYGYIRMNDDASGKWTAVTYTSTGSWSTVKTTSADVKLVKGTNTIWVSGSTRGSNGNDWVNLDYIDLTYQPARYEAEAGTVHYGTVKTESAASFSGGGHVGNLNTQAVINSVSDISSDWSNIPYVKYTVDVPAAGDYTINIGFATQTSTVYGYIRINNDPSGKWTAIAYSSTGAWNTVKTTSVTVTLNAGANTIWVSGSTKGSTGDNWINLDYIDLAAKN